MADTGELTHTVEVDGRGYELSLSYNISERNTSYEWSIDDVTDLVDEKDIDPDIFERRLTNQQISDIADVVTNTWIERQSK